MIVAIVPMRCFTQGKTRLAETLSTDERRALMVAMFQRVITALRGAQSIDQIVVVSKASDVISEAERLGVLSLQEAETDDLNSGLTKALAFSESLHTQQALIMHADLPLADSQTIDFFVRHHQKKSITLLPSHDFVGTNMMMLDLPLSIELAFGAESYRKHQEAARAANLPVRSVALPSLALDIDISSDLVTLQKLEAATSC